MTQGASSTGIVLAFVRLTFIDRLTYRLRYVVGIMNYVIYMAVQYFLWSAVYASSPDPEAAIGTFRFHEIVQYFAVGWVIRVSYYNNIDRELSDRVSQGDVALDLLRPMSLLQRYYGEALGEALFRIGFMGIPTALVLFPLFGVGGPDLSGSAAAAAVRATAFTLSVVLAFHVFFLVNFLVGAMTVFFETIQGLIWAKFVLLQFLSGLLVPFDLFPAWARRILEILPFRGMAYGPLQIYLGRATGLEAAKEIALQLFWALALYVAARGLWSACRRRLLVQGG